MNRRTLLSFLPSLPFLGALKPAKADGGGAWFSLNNGEWLHVSREWLSEHSAEDLDRMINTMNRRHEVWAVIGKHKWWTDETRPSQHGDAQ